MSSTPKTTKRVSPQCVFQISWPIFLTFYKKSNYPFSPESLLPDSVLSLPFQISYIMAREDSHKWNIDWFFHLKFGLEGKINICWIIKLSTNDLIHNHRVTAFCFSALDSLNLGLYSSSTIFSCAGTHSCSLPGVQVIIELTGGGVNFSFECAGVAKLMSEAVLCTMVVSASLLHPLCLIGINQWEHCVTGSQNQFVKKGWTR